MKEICKGVDIYKSVQNKPQMVKKKKKKERKEIERNLSPYLFRELSELIEEILPSPFGF